MTGIKTNLRDLGNSFRKSKAMEAAAFRRDAVIKELIQSYIRKGHTPYMAFRMAETQYLSIHKNQKHESNY